MRSSKGRPYGYYICSKSLLTYLSKEERCGLPSVPRDKLDRAVWRFVEALYENSDAIMTSFQEAQVQRRRDNAAIEEKIAGLEHTLSDQRAKQENLWLEVASLPKDATTSKTALHNVIHRLDEAIAEGVEKVMVLRSKLLPIPDEGALTTFWQHRDKIRDGIRVSETVEERRVVIDALNVTVSVHGVEGKPKATLHWWGMDAPLSLDEEAQGGNQGTESAPTSGITGNEGGRYPLSADKKAYQVSYGLA